MAQKWKLLTTMNCLFITFVSLINVNIFFGFFQLFTGQSDRIPAHISFIDNSNGSVSIIAHFCYNRCTFIIFGEERASE